MIPPDSRGDDAIMQNLLALADLLGSGEPAGLAGQLEADFAWSQEDHVAELAGLAVPALAVANEHDPLFPPALVRQAVAAMPDAELVVVPGANHVSLEPNALLDEALMKFLSRVS
jgi:pimeloyl-ACP methyl ester carboxylesterase